MIPLFGTDQIKSADTFAIEKLQIPSLVLMENAARSIFEIFEQITDSQFKGEKITIICGKGNNGGDGYALARHLLNNNYKVQVFSLFPEKELSSDSYANFKIWKNIIKSNKNGTHLIFSSAKDIKYLNNSKVIFDAMLGTGAKGELREPFAKIVNDCNSIDSFKVAIDVPTGLNADTGFGNIVFNADLTVTLAGLKKGLFIGEGKQYCGIIKTGAIGIGNSYFEELAVSEYLVEPEDAFNFLPSRNVTSQKYSAGKVLSVAGSEKYPGAACLTANAVLNSGAGASVLAFPGNIKSIAQTKLNSAVVYPYHSEFNYLIAESVDDFEEYLYWADAIALGPGIGREDATEKAVLKIIELASKNNIVIDADAINLLKCDNYKKISLKGKVLTPHHKEFSDLLGIPLIQLKEDLLHYGKTFADETGAYLVLKGAPTIIFFPNGECFVNSVGNSGMSKFGVGDVLTGVIASFIAQGDNLEEAIISAVYVHSLAADLLAERIGEYGITAELISSTISEAIKFLEKTFE